MTFWLVAIPVTIAFVFGMPFLFAALGAIEAWYDDKLYRLELAVARFCARRGWR